MSILGATGYAHDVSYALPRCRELLYIAWTSETWDDEFEERMSELEARYAKRAEQSWEHPGKGNARQDSREGIESE